MRWRDVEPLAGINGELGAVLASVDALRAARDDVLSRVTPEDFTESRRRSLRRHAIETGIIERLYDVDWGVTEALVAEGLTAEVAEREGGIDDDTLALIRSQFDALEFLADAARAGTPLTVFFVRQLHTAISRHQRTYAATDPLGNPVQAPLHHGKWKTWANHVRRPDGTLLEYTPPEHVQSQMERMVELYGEQADAHPLIRAAWLHHRFICIHPFEDGNGRVARALSLLVLLQARYAPLAVDRRDRDEYIRALDAANERDLRPLVRLFSRLEIVALRAELERPVRPTAAAGSVSVAHAFADQIRGLRATDTEEVAKQAASLAAALHGRLITLVGELGRGVRDAFRQVDPDARHSVASAAPPADEARHWWRQVLTAARQADFFVNRTGGYWWIRLYLTVFGQTLRYLVVVQKVGHGETGVLAVTAYAAAVAPDTPEDGEVPERLLELQPTDSVTLVYTHELDTRWDEVSQFVDQTLAAAVSKFARGLG